MHGTKGVLPLVKRPYAPDQRIQVQPLVGHKAQHGLPYRIVVTEAAAQGYGFPDQQVQRVTKGSGPHPTLVIQPAGLTICKAVCSAAETPVASMTP